MVYGGICEEISNSNYYYMKEHPGCLHGKLYKREIIDKYNLRFTDTKYSEDNYFNQLYTMLSPSILGIEETVYVYNNSEKSLTKDNEELLSYYYNYNMNCLHQDAKKHNVPGYKKIDSLLNSLCYNYRQYVLSDYRKKYYISHPKQFLSSFLKKYENHISDYDYKKKLMQYSFDVLEKISFYEYLNLIKE